MADKLDGDAIVANSVQGNRIQNGTITSSQLDPAIAAVVSVPAHPKISSLDYPGDDTAANTGGGDTIVIRGAGFKNNVAVYINGNAVPSVTYNNANAVTITTAAQSSGSYLVYLTNTDDGGTAILVPGIQYSGLPSWVSESPLTAQDASWDITLSANSDSSVTYSLQAGSTLPDGITLAANGLISGTMSSPPASTTTYNFTVVATDAELQDTPKAFSVSVTINDPYFPYTTLLLPGNGTNNQNNHTFLDSSNNNFTITRNGNATQGTFSPFSQTGWGAYFDGTGDYLTGPTANAAFDFGSGDFTIEAWAYPTVLTTDRAIIISLDSATNSAYSFGLLVKSTGAAQIALWNGSSYFINITSTTGVVFLNEWNHIAAVRSGSDVAIFVNGTRVGSASGVSGTQASNNILNIGRDPYAGGSLYFIGYLSNIRVVKGTAVYDPTQTTLSVPTAPLTAISGTSLLTCQSNRFIDNSSNAFAITVNGDTSIQAFSPFNPTAAWDAATNGGSGYFDGSGDYLSVPDDNDLTLAGDFTIEFWFYATTAPSSVQVIISKWSAGGQEYLILLNTNYGFDWYWAPASVSVPMFSSSNNAYRLNEWTHVAIVRSGSTQTIYANGVSVGTGTNGTDGTNGPEPVWIGRYDVYYFPGYLSGVRIVKGTAVYTTAFTPPTAPLTAITNTQLLCNFTNAGIYDATAKNALETVGDAKISTVQSKFGGSSMYFDGTGDYLRVRDSSLFTLGSGDFTIEAWVYPTLVNSAQHHIAGQADSSGTASTRSFRLSIETSNKFVGRVTSGSTSYDALSANTAVANTWQHVAFVRDGNTTRLFVDGVEEATDDVTGVTVNDSSNQFGIGAQGELTSALFAGYIQDFRFTKGYARYTTGFTPPTAAFAKK